MDFQIGREESPKASLDANGRRLLEMTTRPAAESFSPKTLLDLEWVELLDRLAANATTVEGAERLRDLPFLSDVALVERRLSEVQEAMVLSEESEDIPISGVKDLRHALALARRDGVLDGESLAAIALHCDIASRTGRFLRHRSEKAPNLALLASGLDRLDELRQALHHAVEPGGRLKDEASPDLGKLRRAVQNQTDRIKSRVDQMLKSDELAQHLQDDYFTVRDERYVFPVRSSSKNLVGGIIHGQSSSGQTAYVEPNELIELNNQLRWAQIEVEEEERRVLARLSSLVSRHTDTLAQNARIFLCLDVIRAKSRLARDLKASVPTLSDDELRLNVARHPLLFLTRETIPNDVYMEPGKRVLIVSGPNTGGKTVLLKMVGLLSLMVQAGMPIPADASSTMPLFDAIYTDIGDEQSIEKDLSTFSGHLVNIAGFIGRCTEKSLVLLDELCNGTDPGQGSALAVALLEELHGRGAMTVVTTHLEGLKTLALEDESYINASMGFDIENLAPTYRVTMGVPGSSYALKIAERLGLAQHLVDRAKELLDEDKSLSVDIVLSRLEDQARALREEERRLTKARKDAEREQQRFEKKYKGLLTSERALVHEETKALKEELDTVREHIREIQSALSEEIVTVTRKDIDLAHERFRDFEDTIEKARETTASSKTSPDGMIPIDKDELREGMEVYCSPLNRSAEVVRYRKGDDQAEIQVGLMKMSVATQDLFHASDASSAVTRTRSKEPPQAEPAKSSSSVTVQTSENTLDLRGMRVEDALERLDLFLDGSFGRNVFTVFIIHGHGTGALKRAVRGMLLDSRYIDEFRRGERQEGGDGVTVAHLSATPGA